jgi:hypothetical protein
VLQLTIDDRWGAADLRAAWPAPIQASLLAAPAFIALQSAAKRRRGDLDGLFTDI